MKVTSGSSRRPARWRWAADALDFSFVVGRSSLASVPFSIVLFSNSTVFYPVLCVFCVCVWVVDNDKRLKHDFHVPGNSSGI